MSVAFYPEYRFNMKVGYCASLITVATAVAVGPAFPISIIPTRQPVRAEIKVRISPLEKEKMVEELQQLQVALMERSRPADDPQQTTIAMRNPVAQTSADNSEMPPAEPAAPEEVPREVSSAAVEPRVDEPMNQRQPEPERPERIAEAREQSIAVPSREDVRSITPEVDDERTAADDAASRASAEMDAQADRDRESTERERQRRERTARIAAAARGGLAEASPSAAADVALPAATGGAQSGAMPSSFSPASTARPTASAGPSSLAAGSGEPSRRMDRGVSLPSSIASVQGIGAGASRNDASSRGATPSSGSEGGASAGEVVAALTRKARRLSSVAGEVDDEWSGRDVCLKILIGTDGRVKEIIKLTMIPDNVKSKLIAEINSWVLPAPAEPISHTLRFVIL